MGTYLDKTGLQTLWTKIKERDNATLSAANQEAASKDTALLNSIAEAYVAKTLIGALNGIAPLDASGKISSSYLPGYVDDVVEYNNRSAFPSTGEAGKIYVAKDTNKTYRWSGSAYVEISASLALGETTGTAYDGGKGAATATSLNNLINRIVQDIDDSTDQNAIPNWSAMDSYLQNSYQVKLISGTNIKTVNGQSILGSGNISITVDSIDMSGYLPTTGGTITDDLTVNADLYVNNAIYIGDEPVALQSDIPTDYVKLNNNLIELPSGGIIYKDGVNANEYAGFCVSPTGVPVVISKDLELCFTTSNDYVMYTHTFTFPNKNGTVALTSDIPTALTTAEINEICT